MPQDYWEGKQGDGSATKTWQSKVQSGLKKAFQKFDDSPLGKYVDKTTRMDKGSKQK
jgi:hypothetical protein